MAGRRWEVIDETITSYCKSGDIRLAASGLRRVKPPTCKVRHTKRNPVVATRTSEIALLKMCKVELQLNEMLTR